MKFYIMIEKALSEHIIMVILQFVVKMWFLNKNNFISRNYLSFFQNYELWYRTHSLKI